MSAITAIVLSAGLGKRMKSALPKVLHRAAGRPLVLYPVKAALDAGASADPSGSRGIEPASPCARRRSK